MKKYNSLLRTNTKTQKFEEYITFPYEGDPLVNVGEMYHLDGFKVRFVARDGSFGDFVGPVVCPEWAVTMRRQR